MALRVYLCALPRTNIVMPGLSDDLEKSRAIRGSLYGLVESACRPAPGASCYRFSFRLTPDSPLAAAAVSGCRRRRLWLLPLPSGCRCRCQAKTYSPPLPPSFPGSPRPLPPCRPRVADAVAPAPSLTPLPSSSVAIAPAALLAVAWVVVDKG